MDSLRDLDDDLGELGPILVRHCASSGNPHQQIRRRRSGVDQNHVRPGDSIVAGVSSVVSCSDAGCGEDADRISTAVPVLGTVSVTVPTVVGFGSSNIRPTPLLKFGNGTGSVYVSVGHTVLGSPSMASRASWAHRRDRRGKRPWHGPA